MSRIRYILVFVLFFSTSAIADVWKWTDATGNTHFVESDKAIFMWVDESGKTNYSDSPDHQDAVAVQLVWHSKGSLRDLNPIFALAKNDDYAAETEMDRIERETAEAYYCKRATEIYDSYINAPRLYKTNKKGEKEYLSKKEEKAEVASTKAKMDDLCK